MVVFRRLVRLYASPTKCRVSSLSVVTEGPLLASGSASMRGSIAHAPLPPSSHSDCVLITAEEFLNRHQMKDILRKHVSELTNTSSMTVGSLKENDSLTAREGVERAMAHPRTLVYVEVLRISGHGFRENGVV